MAVIGLLLVTLVASLPSLRCAGIDDLDSAHHLMDGYFFNDLIHDHPHAHLQQYVFDYYKQYPALGFVFWPPLFPVVLGIFCLFGGAHVLTGRICILCFSAVFGISFYAILRRKFPPWLAWCATISALTVPGIAWSLNQIMLELPTIAVMCVAILAYLHLRDHVDDSTSIPRALLCAIALAAVIYTKQPGYFVYGAIAFDVFVHPGLLRKSEIWIAAVALVLLSVPLLLFTLKFGHADLAQSVGSNTTLIMSHYHETPRWSLAAWTFYPRLALTLLNPIVVLLACGALILSICYRSFRRSYALWLGWFLFAYVTFSFYDNRLPRHSTFWWPAWIALAAACLQHLALKVPLRYRAALPLLFLFPVPWQLARSQHQDYTDFRDQRPIVANMFATGSPGNVLVFGPDKQTFIALIREYDPSRQVHILRGDSLLSAGQSVDEMCRKYRIRFVLVELPHGGNLAGSPGLHDLAAAPQFRALPSGSFLRQGVPIQVIEFRYVGPMDPMMSDVPLSDRLL